MLALWRYTTAKIDVAWINFMSRSGVVETNEIHQIFFASSRLMFHLCGVGLGNNGWLINILEESIFNKLEHFNMDFAVVCSLLISHPSLSLILLRIFYFSLKLSTNFIFFLRNMSLINIYSYSGHDMKYGNRKLSRIWVKAGETRVYISKGKLCEFWEFPTLSNPSQQPFSNIKINFHFWTQLIKNACCWFL